MCVFCPLWGDNVGFCFSGAHDASSDIPLLALHHVVWRWPGEAIRPVLVTDWTCWLMSMLKSDASRSTPPVHQVITNFSRWTVSFASCHISLQTRPANPRRWQILSPALILVQTINVASSFLAVQFMVMFVTKCAKAVSPTYCGLCTCWLHSVYVLTAALYCPCLLWSVLQVHALLSDPVSLVTILLQDRTAAYLPYL